VKYKEKYGYLLAATLSVAALLCTAAILMMLPKEENSPQNEPLMTARTEEADEMTGGPEAEPKEKYIMKLYNGNLAVFDAKDPETPQFVTGIDERTLRDTDRDAFEKGVPVYSDEELASLLEDYGS